MSRRLKVSSAQLGPIHRADSRASVVKRMIEMLKEADSRGSVPSRSALPRLK